MAYQPILISFLDSNRIPAHPGDAFSSSRAVSAAPSAHRSFATCARGAQIQSAGSAARVIRQGCGAGPHWQPRRWNRRSSHLWSVGQWASLVKPGTRPPVAPVMESRLMCTALPSEVMPNTAVNLTGPEVTCSLIKLQLYDGTGYLDTFLTKFQRMAVYLCSDDEDIFHYLCACLEETRDKSCGTLVLVRQPLIRTTSRQGLALSSKQRDLRPSCAPGVELLTNLSSNCTRISVA